MTGNLLKVVSEIPITGFVPIERPIRKGDVRFASQADICSAKRHVRFTPNSDRESGHGPMVMSALPSKADMCAALVDVR